MNLIQRYPIISFCVLGALEVLKPQTGTGQLIAAIPRMILYSTALSIQYRAGRQAWAERRPAAMLGPLVAGSFVAELLNSEVRKVYQSAKTLLMGEMPSSDTSVPLERMPLSICDDECLPPRVREKWFSLYSDCERESLEMIDTKRCTLDGHEEEALIHCVPQRGTERFVLQEYSPPLTNATGASQLDILSWSSCIAKCHNVI